MTTQHSTNGSATPSGRKVARVATISTGTFLLCLAAAAPALANTTPTPLPVLGTGTSTSPVSTTPGNDPIGDLVKQVTTIAGIPDPLSAGSAKAKAAKPTVHRHKHKTSTASTAASAPKHRTTAARHQTSGTVTSTALTPAGVPGLRRLPPAWAEVSAPASAPAVAAAPAPRHSTPISLASQAQHFVSTLARDGVPASRLVAMILGTMIIGVLAGAHIRQMQASAVKA